MAGCLLASLAQWPGRDEMVGENLPRSKESPGPGAGAAGTGGGRGDQFQVRDSSPAHFK